jgi:hypothetical protein
MRLPPGCAGCRTCRSRSARTGRLGDVRVGGVGVRINALTKPGGVGGVAEWDASRATVADTVVVAIAGPAASLAGVLVTAWGLGVVGAGLVHDLLWAATTGGAFGVLNLIQLHVHDADGKGWRTDGRVVPDALVAGAAHRSGSNRSRAPASRSPQTTASHAGRGAWPATRGGRFRRPAAEPCPQQLAGAVDRAPGGEFWARLP